MLAVNYQVFTTTRTTEPDTGTLLSMLRALDATAGVQHAAGTQTFVIKKSTAWTDPQTALAQNVVGTCPAASAELAAQSEVDAWPLATKALVLALIDQLNVIRAALPTPLGAITPSQALAAIRQKAGQL